MKKKPLTVRQYAMLILAYQEMNNAKKRYKAKSKTKKKVKGLPVNYQKIADVGPYVHGFYNVKNINGRAIVIWKSAQAMRQYPLRKEPCLKRGEE
jgi:hypothetical protein